jgi:hypothetical protein
MKKLLLFVTLPFAIVSGLMLIGGIALLKKIEEDFEEDYFWE